MNKKEGRIKQSYGSLPYSGPHLGKLFSKVRHEFQGRMVPVGQTKASEMLLGAATASATALDKPGNDYPNLLSQRSVKGA